MSDELNIDNPKQVPFGLLSNNFTSPLLIDGQTWDSVTQYVYTKSTSNYIYQDEIRRELRNLENKTGKNDPYFTFLKYLQLTNESIISRALDEALKVKLENPEVMEILLDTQFKNIEYLSDNPILGIGSNNNGKNLVGKYLMQIRDFHRKNVQFEQVQEQYRQKLYKLYVLYNLLHKEIISGQDDLSIYLVQSGPQTIEAFFNLYIYGRDIQEYSNSQGNKRSKLEEDQRRKNLERTLNDKVYYGLFVERFKNKDPTVYPMVEIFERKIDSIVLYLRSKYLRQFRENRERYMRQKTFNLYFYDKIKKLYPEIPENKYQLVEKQELEKITGMQFDQLKDDLFANRKRLPASLYEKIENELRNVHIPSLDDIVNAEKFNFEKFASQSIQSKPLTDVVPIEIKTAYGGLGPEMPTPVRIKATEYTGNFEEDLKLVQSKSIQALSPTVYTGMININGLVYPTVNHYIYGSLFASLPSVGTHAKAINYLLQVKPLPGETVTIKDFGSFNIISGRFSMMSEENVKQNLETNVEKALEVKFYNVAFQNLLLKTDQKLLIWNSPDPILGIGANRQGLNYVGYSLISWRYQAFKAQIRATEVSLSTENIWDIVQTDPFLTEWIRKKVTDMISVSRKVVNFLNTKYSQLNITLTPKVVSTVLDKIYFPCNSIQSEIQTEVPLFFFNIVKENVKVNTPLISQVLWKRIASMLSELISIQSQTVDNSSLFDFKKLINEIEAFMSLDKQCVKITSKSNCSISAILNLTKAILNLNLVSPTLEKKEVIGAIGEETVLTSIDPTIKEIDIELALSILLTEKFRGKAEVDTFKVFEETEEGLDEQLEEEGIESDDEEEIDYADDEEPEEYEGCGCNQPPQIDGAGDSLSEDIIRFIRNNHMFDYVDELTGVEQSYVLNYDTFADWVSRAVNKIEKSRLLKGIKTNRINYFATLV